MSELEYYDLEGAPMVRVYKNLLPSIDRIHEVLIDSEKNPEKYSRFGGWRQWNNLGTQVPAGLGGYSKEYVGKDTSFFWPDLISSDLHKEEVSLLSEMYDAYFISLEHYSKSHGLDYGLETFPDGPAFYKYDHSLQAPTPNTPEFHMNYHTDFAFSLKGNPGKKSITTTTMYLNDNYLGGEVVYNIEPRLARPYYKRSEQFAKDESYYSGRVVLTPEKGDVVVFPSGNPEYLSENGYYFHCVNRVQGGDKYFVSFFNSYLYHGSEEYQAGVEEYGEDLWTWLEQRRTFQAGFRKKAVSLNDPGKE